MSKVGIGITTWNRPDYAEKCVKSIAKHCSGLDALYMHDDCSDPKFTGAYRRVHKVLEANGGHLLTAKENAGVAAAKNRLIEHLIADGCDWIILCEDDVRPISAEAVTEYVRICEDNDLHHLAFAHHGSANLNVPLSDSDVTYFPHSIGAWTIFSRECLIKTGLFWEQLVCAWEHVEHTIRLMQDGFLPDYTVHNFPDVTHSQKYLQEIPGSIEKSSIRVRPDWSSNIHNGLRLWKDERRDSYDLLFAPGMPLYNYACNILGEP